MSAGIGADRQHPIRQIVGAFHTKTGVGRHQLSGIAMRLHCACVKQDHVALFDLNASALGGLLDLGAVEAVPSGTGLSRRSPSYPAERRASRWAECSKCVRPAGVTKSKRAPYSSGGRCPGKPVNLAQYRPGLDEIVIADGLVLTHRRAGAIRWLHDINVVAARLISRRLAAGDLAERIGLAGLDKLCGPRRLFGAEIGDRAQPVVGAIL